MHLGMNPHTSLKHLPEPEPEAPCPWPSFSAWLFFGLTAMVPQSIILGVNNQFPRLEQEGKYHVLQLCKWQPQMSVPLPWVNMMEYHRDNNQSYSPR